MESDLSACLSMTIRPTDNRVITSNRSPQLCWDADDELFDKLAERLRYQVGDALEYRPHHGLRELEEQGAEPPDEDSDEDADADAERLLHGISLARPRDVRLSGAAAWLCARTYGGQGQGAWWCYRTVPGYAPVLDALYRLAAGHSRGLARVSRWLIGADFVPAQHRLTRWLCLRLIGVTTLCAFLSMYAQLDGLMGEQGISPAAEFMDRVEDHAERMEALQDGWQPLERYLRVPTLLWLDTSDETLHWLTLLGALFALLLIFDIAPGPMLLGAWIMYLSLTVAGGAFFLYQWDVLLLEALLVGMLVAPWRRIRPRLAGDREPTRTGLWMVRLLVFKLMLLSGLVKYLADDSTWDELTALDYHFFTQPIPSFPAYYAHHLPDSVLAASTAIMFFIELVLPFFMILGLRRLRICAGLGTVLLMVGIGATGNFGFFNLLTVALAVSLFDDTALARFAGPVRSWLPARDRRPPMPGRIARTVGWVLVVPIVWTSGVRSCQRVERDYEPGETSAWLLEQTGSLHSINSYGLFARMTTTRPEIVLEGSRDRVVWETYHFRYKPTALDDRPPIIGLHMPRLDWQMWFAALRGCQRASWFHNFMLRLLEGRGPVRELLAHDPFGVEPPTYLRSTVYRYTFTDLGSDDWWQRERIGPFCPTVTLRDGRLAPVR